jgi:CBS domain-containing protein
MNKVSQVLKLKGDSVWKIQINATVLEALKLMAEKQISSVMVMDGNQVAGIFTERDFAHKVGLLDENPSTVKVGEVITRELITVTPNTSINQCMAIVTDHRVRHLPVLEDGQLVGIISIGDIVKDMIEELEFVVEQLEKYITNFR